MGTSSSKQTPPDPTNPVQRDQKRPSLLARLSDRNTPISDEDLKKYTGKSSEELKTWMQDAPGVGRNQKAGKVGMGPGTGGAVVYGAD